MNVPDEWLPRRGLPLPYKTRLTDRLVPYFPLFFAWRMNVSQRLIFRPDHLVRLYRLN